MTFTNGLRIVSDKRAQAYVEFILLAGAFIAACAIAASPIISQLKDAGVGMVDSATARINGQ